MGMAMWTGSALVALDVSTNNISGRLPDQLVGGPALGLRYLYLSRNSLTGAALSFSESWQCLIPLFMNTDLLADHVGYMIICSHIRVSCFAGSY